MIAQSTEGSELGGEVEIFSNFGPFEVMKSSETLLGLAEDAERSERIYFSLWTEPLFGDESLINFPLILDAKERGFDSVELIEIKGTRALIRLNELRVNDEESAQAKGVLAVYDVLGDRLIELESFFTIERLIELDLNAGSMDVEWQEMRMYKTWVSRIAKIGESRHLLITKVSQ